MISERFFKTIISITSKIHFLFSANLLDLASSAPAPHNNSKEKAVVNDVLRYNDLLKWDYEYEKSYWFDTSALIVGNTAQSHQQHNTLHNDSLGAAASSSSSSSTASCSPPRLGRSFSGKLFDFRIKTDTQQGIPNFKIGCSSLSYLLYY